MGDFEGAEATFRQGLAAAPNDSDLTQALRSARTNRANQLIHDKKTDEAIAYFQDLLKDDPKDGDLWAGIGDAQFTKARDAQGDAKKPAFKAAADSYAKAAALKPESSELAFNAAICYQNADDMASAETQWRAVLKTKPDDKEALTELSNVLAEQKKFPEAVTMAQKALALDPKDKNAHKQLGAIYNKSQDNLHSKQALLAFLALDKGHEVPAPTDASGAAGQKLVASAGKPDLIVDWDADNAKYETFFYWAKGQAYHFGGGAQLEKTDWSAALASK
jgi:Flp pilus assembly protein TadD